ncbi:MAG: hypothetical protein QXT86_12340, partial [Archaeoglobaceae archaeon]
MPVVYRWWMNYSDEKRDRVEHRIEEDREGREFRFEGAKGVKDINRSNIEDRSNITFNSMVNDNNQELSMDMENSSLESVEQEEESGLQNRERCSCQAKNEEGEEHVAESGAHQLNDAINDVSSDEESSTEYASTNLDETSNSEDKEVGEENIGEETDDEENIGEESKDDFNESFTKGNDNEDNEASYKDD